MEFILTQYYDKVDSYDRKDVKNKYFVLRCKI